MSFVPASSVMASKVVTAKSSFLCILNFLISLWVQRYAKYFEILSPDKKKNNRDYFVLCLLIRTFASGNYSPTTRNNG